MQWVLEHWSTIASILAFLVTLFQAWRKGTLLKTVILGVEAASDTTTKRIIAAVAEDAGLLKALDKVVQRHTEPADNPPL